jgi:biopolymer transport protein ExbB/TolQ|tara:strand:- start:516 stop:905 length:390 start_codon:yes stop_codon:yes gene_type:complete
MPYPKSRRNKRVGQKSGGGGCDTASAPPTPPPCAKNLFLTVILASLPLICALFYQHIQISKTNKELATYSQLLEQLNKKENLTKEEKQIKEDLEEKLEEKQPNNNKTNFIERKWHNNKFGGSNSRRKTR